MANQPRIYQRLRGTGYQSDSSVRLYLGPDHLLQVMSNGFTESYKRFFFQDIQTLSCQRTNGWHAWTILWATMALLWTVVALESRNGPSLVVTAVSVLMLLGNLYLGPSCACYVQTAVQTQRLPSLRRVRQARKVIEQLRTFIVQAQGELSSQDAIDRLTGAREPSPASAEPVPVSPPVQS